MDDETHSKPSGESQTCMAFKGSVSELIVLKKLIVFI